jgi:hypothetical protein
VKAADQRVLKEISALSVMVGDIGRVREDSAWLRAENARLQTQISNISVNGGGGSPEARMFGDAQFVEAMIEWGRFEYDMRLAAGQRSDMIADDMKSAKEEIASLRAQLRDAENDAEDLEAWRLNDAEEQVFGDGYPWLAALVDRLQKWACLAQWGLEAKRLKSCTRPVPYSGADVVQETLVRATGRRAGVTEAMRVLGAIQGNLSQAQVPRRWLQLRAS